MKWQPKRERDVVRPFQERVASAADNMLNSHWDEYDVYSMRRIFHLKQRQCAIPGCYQKATTQEHMIDIVTHKTDVRGVHGLCNILPMCLQCNEAANYAHGYKKMLINDSVHDFFLNGQLNSTHEAALHKEVPCKYEMYKRIMTWLQYCEHRKLSLSYKWKREHTTHALNALDVCWKKLWNAENKALLQQRPSDKIQHTNGEFFTVRQSMCNRMEHERNPQDCK